MYKRQAYAYGGVNLAMKTINQNFNMNITDYAIVNFANLASIIDEIGGKMCIRDSHYSRCCQD